MQGALYFPFIRVPNNAWWTRTLLYWDSVATITPKVYMEEPDLHDPYTLELVRSELLHQVSPYWAEDQFGKNFQRFINSHSPEELQRRRDNFRMGKVARVHMDKFVFINGLMALMHDGMAEVEDNSSWVLVEETFASEIMAALALSLCEAADQREWSQKATPFPERWVPVTDDKASTRALLAGLRPASDDQDMKVELRVHGQLQRAEILSVALPALLPVPEDPMSVDAIISFRNRYGELLPQFRRDLEDRVQKMADLDPVDRQLAMDRLEDDVRERTIQVSAYLSENRVHNVVSSPLWSLIRLLPAPVGDIAGALVGVVQEDVKQTRQHETFKRDPLAYLAFANSELAPVQKYTIAQGKGLPLISTVYRSA